jgi:hypothetical protein
MQFEQSIMYVNPFACIMIQEGLEFQYNTEYEYDERGCEQHARHIPTLHCANDL